jgi:hypothetical protein
MHRRKERNTSTSKLSCASVFFIHTARKNGAKWWRQKGSREKVAGKRLAGEGLPVREGKNLEGEEMLA